MISFTDLRIHPASDADRAKGCLAFIALTLPGGIRADGLVLRKTAKGTLSLSFPERRTASGTHPILRPVSPAARLEFESAVIAEVRRQRLGR